MRRDVCLEIPICKYSIYMRVADIPGDGEAENVDTINFTDFFSVQGE